MQFTMCGSVCDCVTSTFNDLFVLEIIEGKNVLALAIFKRAKFD